MTLAKSANPTTFTAAGQTITYTYTVTNTGTPLGVNGLIVTDNKVAIVTCNDSNLVFLQSTTCTGSYTTTSTDASNGKVVNNAQASAAINDSPLRATSNVATATVNFIGRRRGV